MRVQVFQLFWKAGDGPRGLVPSDEELYRLAMEYADANLNFPIEFRDYKFAWVACEVDDGGKPTRALGILCGVMRVDFTVCRFTDNAAVVKLVQRANDHLHDVYALRGDHALVYIAKQDDQRCPDYEEWMKMFDLQPADRWACKVR